MSVVLVDPVSSGALFVTEFLARGADFSVVVSGELPEVFEQQIATLQVDHPEIEVLRVGPDRGVADVASYLRTRGADYVVCGGETGVGVADELREALGIAPRNPGGSATRLDKFAAQDALRAAGLPCIPSRLVRELADLRDCADWPYPAIVKPVSSAGTDGVRRVEDPSELCTAVADVLGRTNALGRPNEGVVVQQFIEGTEYVLDGYRNADRHSVSSVCRYRKSMLLGSPVYDLLEWLDWAEVPDADQLQDYFASVLDCLGVRVGSFHAEFFRTDDGWVLIELGLRPHGGGHPSYTEALTGSSQVGLEVSAALHEHPDLDRGMRLHRKGCVRFLSVPGESRVDTAPAVRLRDIAGVLNVAVELDAGDLVVPPRSLFDTFKIGYVVLSGLDRNEIADRIAEVDSIFAECVRPIG